MKRQPAEPLTTDEAASLELWLDVSSHQGEVDWPAVARSLPNASGTLLPIPSGVVVRLGEGKDVDDRAVRNLQGAHAAGLKVAGYQYFRADRDGATQAAQVLETLRVAGVPVLFVACDREAGEDDNLPGGIVEGPRSEDLPFELVTDEALEFCHAIDRAGHQVVIYGGQWLHWKGSQARPDLLAPFARWPLWVPWYSVGAVPSLPADRTGNLWPWPSWAIWQFAGSEKVPGRLNGIRGRVDLNWLRPEVLEHDTKPVSLVAAAVRELEDLAARLKPTHPEEAAKVGRLIDELSRREQN